MRAFFRCFGGGLDAEEKGQKTPRIMEATNNMYSAPNDSRISGPALQHRTTETGTRPRLVTSLPLPKMEGNMLANATGDVLTNMGEVRDSSSGMDVPNMNFSDPGPSAREARSHLSLEQFSHPTVPPTVPPTIFPASVAPLSPVSGYSEMRERIRRAYESESRGFNPFMTDRDGNRISNLEGMTRMAQMYYSEGGPFHPRQVALRAAEPDPYKRDQMYKHSLLASYNRMVQYNFGSGGVPSGSSLRSADPESALVPRAATLHNNQGPTAQGRKDPIAKDPMDHEG